jgi:hypothetical protein
MLYTKVRLGHGIALIHSQDANAMQVTNKQLKYTIPCPTKYPSFEKWTPGVVVVCVH